MDEIQMENENLIKLDGKFQNPAHAWAAAQKLEHTDYVQSIEFNLEGWDSVSEPKILRPKKRIISLKEKVMIMIYKINNTSFATINIIRK